MPPAASVVPVPLGSGLAVERHLVALVGLEAVAADGDVPALSW